MVKELPPTAFGTTSLGDLISALMECNYGASVQFDFCYLAPTFVASYRGYYDHLALGWTADFRDRPTVSTVIDILQSADGETFEGWKGGDFTMDRDTPIWVANPGQTGGTGIVGLKLLGENCVVLLTTHTDDY